MFTESLSLNIFLTVLIFVALILALYILELILSYIYLFIVCLTCSRTKKYTKFSQYYYHVYLFGARLVCRTCRVKIHINGKEKIPADQKFLLVSNHISNWDNIVQAVALSEYPMAYISKAENFQRPFVGRLVNRCLFLSINRGNLKSGLETILKAKDMVKNQVMSVAVFPEGKRSKDGTLHSFKPGCMKIAEKSKCPLVIVATRDTDKIHSRFPLKRSHVYLDVVDVLMPDLYAGKNTIELAEITQEKIAAFMKQDA